MNQKELRIQAKVLTDFWNRYPEERQLLHTNNNNSADGREGAKNLSLGVVAGVSDMEYVKNGTVHFIELKAEAGVQQPKQISFQKKVESEGFPYWLVYGEKQLTDLLENIRTGKIKKTIRIDN